jgi:hypothetical protein
MRDEQGACAVITPMVSVAQSSPPPEPGPLTPEAALDTIALAASLLQSA